jgi:hypothetical protein
VRGPNKYPEHVTRKTSISGADTNSSNYGKCVTRNPQCVTDIPRGKGPRRSRGTAKLRPRGATEKRVHANEVSHAEKSDTSDRHAKVRGNQRPHVEVRYKPGDMARLARLVAAGHLRLSEVARLVETPTSKLTPAQQRHLTAMLAAARR